MSDERAELASLARGLAAAVERSVDRGERLTRPLPPRATGAPPAPPRESVGEPDAITPAPRRQDDLFAAPTGAEGHGGRAEPDNENARKARTAEDLPALKQMVADCTACTLCETRTQTVFADGKHGGTERARVMFVGEAPGQHEDEQGVPFVGRAGQLLTDIIQKGMGLRREDVYIANVLKCRPPNNRDPEPLEKALCTPYLDRQIELVEPEVLVPLGLHAARHLLSSSDSMGRLRGRVHQRRGVKVVPTYHPAYLLRSPSMKKECWKDIQVAMRELGLRPERG